MSADNLPAWQKRRNTYRQRNVASEQGHQDKIAYRVFRGLKLAKPSKDVYEFEASLGLHLDAALPMWDRAALILSLFYIKGARPETQEMRKGADGQAHLRLGAFGANMLVLFTHDVKTDSFPVYMLQSTADAILGGLRAPYCVTADTANGDSVLKQGIARFMEQVCEAGSV